MYTMHIGGAYQFDFWQSKPTQALHGSAVIDDKLSNIAIPVDFY